VSILKEPQVLWFGGIRGANLGGFDGQVCLSQAAQGQKLFICGDSKAD
jgi:hypothetical protein